MRAPKKTSAAEAIQQLMDSDGDRMYGLALKLCRDRAETMPRRGAPPPDHSQRVCLDLLSAKQEALDRGVDFPCDLAICVRAANHCVRRWI